MHREPRNEHAAHAALLLTTQRAPRRPAPVQHSLLYRVIHRLINAL